MALVILLFLLKSTGYSQASTDPRVSDILL